MPNPKNKCDQQPVGDVEIERLVHGAMRRMNEIPSVDVREVAKIEAELAADPQPLPESLKDANAIFDEALSPKPRTIAPCLPIQSDAAEQLARAAREGGEISPSVEEKMRCNSESQRNEQAGEP